MDWGFASGCGREGRLVYAGHVGYCGMHISACKLAKCNILVSTWHVLIFSNLASDISYGIQIVR
jgi:hypothetical protein